MFSIGDVSRQTGVKIPTIRYYEKLGLLTEPERTEGNQRRYFADERDRLVFIKHCRDLGLPISSIRELIELGKHPDIPCGEADRIAKDHLKAVQERIVQLRRLEQELKRISNACNGGDVGECNVIKALSDHTSCSSDH